MNKAQIEFQRKQLDRELAELDTEIADAVATKSYGSLGEYEKRVTELAQLRQDLDAEEQKSARSDDMSRRILGAYDDTNELGVSGEAADSHRLNFSKKMAEGLVSRKSVATDGASIVAQDFRPNPIALGKPATGLLDVLPTVPHGSPEYAYLRQNSRTNNAAVVHEGDVKPTSVYSVVRITQSLNVIAHLSEGIPHYWLNDNATLTGFIQTELMYGLSRAVEKMVLDDINGTSGIATQVFASNIWTTLRKSMTQLETTGYVPHAIVLHPSDFETIELALSTTNAVEHIGLPYDAAQRRLYGVPIATTITQTQGVGHVLASGAVSVDIDTTGIQLRWSDQATLDFQTNMVRARLEGRYGASIYQPAGVVKAALA
jgi:HK97 family phage major capsid protein